MTIQAILAFSIKENNLISKVKPLFNWKSYLTKEFFEILYYLGNLEIKIFIIIKNYS